MNLSAQPPIVIYSLYAMEILQTLKIIAPAFTLAQEATDQSATPVFKTNGDAIDVTYQTCTSKQPCEGMTRAAAGYDAEVV